MIRIRLYLFMVVLLLASIFGGLTWLGNRLYPAIRFVEDGGERARFGITKFIAHWKAIDTVYQDLDQCAVENQQLENVRASFALVEKELNELKTLVRFVERQKINVITARVFGFGVPGEHQGYFDAGTLDGVVIQYPVIGISGNIVGIVTRVEDHRSVITFLSSPKLSLPVITTNSLVPLGVTQGGRGNEISLGYIPRQAEVAANTGVLVPSSGTMLEQELYVGYIDALTNDPSEIFQSAVVVVPEPFDSISKASVLRP